jgi:hypothetical protein
VCSQNFQQQNSDVAETSHAKISRKIAADSPEAGFYAQMEENLSCSSLAGMMICVLCLSEW